MADEVALHEQAELDALLVSMSQTQKTPTGYRDQIPTEDDMDSLLWSMDEQPLGKSAHREQPQPETPYASDDEEYEHIFMDVIQEENRMVGRPEHHEYADQDMMDMS